MSVTDPARGTNCRRLQARGDALEAELAALKPIVAQLSQQPAAARKGSSTSSEPPSSDIVKPPESPPPQGQDRRQIGGQPGHPEHDRAACPPEAINAGAFDHRLDSCPSCGQRLRPLRTAPPRVVRQVDVREVPLSIQEHRSHPGWCPHCRKGFEAPLPPGSARGGPVGPSLTAPIAYLKGACHASYATVRTSLRDVVGVTIARGEPARIIGKVSRARERPYPELLDDLPGRARLNVDETGHKNNGARQWAWCFRAGLDTLFKIDSTRSADVLIDVLGAEFDGVPGCDSFSAYRRYQREFGVILQSCLAPLIGAVKFLTTLPGRRDRAYAGRRREASRPLFAVIRRRDALPAAAFRGLPEAARAEVMRRGTREVPETRHGRNLARRFEAHGESYSRFITGPGAGPTDHLAEQATRSVVIDRLIAQGTRSEAGNRWCERIGTVIATCTRRGRSVFAYLEAVVGAWFDGTEAASLLPGG